MKFAINNNSTVDTVTILLKNNANINYKNKDGNLLHYIIKNNNNYKNKSDQTNNINIMKLLFQYKIDPNVVDSNNRTLLEFAQKYQKTIKDWPNNQTLVNLLREYVLKYENIKK